MSGELRFSIVTKEQYGTDKLDLLEDIQNLIENYSLNIQKLKE